MLPGEVRIFKVERIERIEMLNETYVIPSAFEPRRLLTDAWGIWFLENGGLVRRAMVAEPQEMLPWIRGRGEDVENISPKELREMITEEVRCMAMIYQI